MSKPFDATLKHLLELSPLSWADLAGFPAASVEVIDADVSTVTGASDKTLRASGDIEWLLDINFQRGPDASVPRRTHLYSTLLEYRHQLPVRSVVVLLTPKAQLSVISGTHQRGFPGEEPYDTFRYWVLKVWELPPERLLSGGAGDAAPGAHRCRDRGTATEYHPTDEGPPGQFRDIGGEGPLGGDVCI